MANYDETGALIQAMNQNADRIVAALLTNAQLDSTGDYEEGYALKMYGVILAQLGEK